LFRAIAVLGLVLSLPLAAAERDICDGKQGPELIRCIESAARLPQNPGREAEPAPGAAKPSREAPAAVTRPSAPPVATIPSPPPEDCTGKAEEALRHCLAAGGRLSPEAVSVTTPSPNLPAGSASGANCDRLSGEALRRCVEAQAQAPQPAAASLAPLQIVPCTGYHAADQPLCLHRNSALAECRNRQKYPDHAVCMRSMMSRAPEPAYADCAKLQARSRTHCEDRNRVYKSCVHDKIGYFHCLSEKLGPDAILTRR
jgi:hypothetical protein